MHEYGKLLLEAALRSLGVRLIDGGVSADPDAVAAAARLGGADFIAVSTYSGVALTCLAALRAEMARAGLALPMGAVHALANEAQFMRASVISAFYGWVYALLDETIAWTAAGDVPPEIARSLVLETTRGAAELALARARTAAERHPRRPGDARRDHRHGLSVLRRDGGLAAWAAA